MNNGYFGDDSFSFSKKAHLETDTPTLSEAGGTVNFELDAEPDNANRNYILLGSVSGTEPGFALPGGMATLPLNWDAFTDVVLLLLNTPVFSDFLGVLDGNAQAAAQLYSGQLPPGYVGTILYFAYCLNGPFDFASNPVEIEIVE
jgi:hypothetical protein